MIRFQNVLKRSLQGVLKTSSKRLEDLLKMSWSRLENVLKMPWRRFRKTSWRRFEDVLARRLEYVLKTFGEYIRLDQDVLKTSWIRLLKTKMKDVFKKPSRRLHQDKCLLGIFSPETWFLCLLWHLYLFSWGSNFLLWKYISINRAHKYVSTSVLMHIEKTTRKHFSCLSRL